MFWCIFIIFLKIWFSAKKSGSRLRYRTMLKNTLKHQKTKHVMRLFEKFLKIRFSAEKCGSRLRISAHKSGSRPRCRTMLKKIPRNTEKTPTKHVLRLFEKLLKILFSAEKDFQIWNYANIPWNTQKTPTKHVLRLFNFFLKIRFSAQTSGSRLRCRTMLKIPWNTQK